MKHYEAIIGLEVHIELATASKMFCPNSASYFGQDPNTHTCPICLGLPGTLPYINQKAIEYCLKIGLALHCRIAQYSVFERKNYFYPDLPKGYQISQYRWPLCQSGWIFVKNKDGQRRKIRINRVHQEEDTGKLFHARGKTLVDFNRAGVPLVEIVTEPDFRDTTEVKDYTRKLQQILRYLQVSNADMERGEMRLEANVSVREKGDRHLPPYRVELKNINSFKFLVSAIDYEVKRQIDILEQEGTLKQETRGWNELEKKTVLQRRKETASDYRYFPDPDLPALSISKKMLNSMKKTIPELPDQKLVRFTKQYAISEQQAEILTKSPALADYFEEAVKAGRKVGIKPAKVANVLINKKVDIAKILPAKLIEIIRQGSTRYTLQANELEKIVLQVIKQFPSAVRDYKNGQVNALQFLVGQAMKQTKGKANPKDLIQRLKTKLEEKK